MAYYARGWVFGNMDNHDKAITDFTAAIQLDPKYAEAYYGRGYAYWRKGDTVKADADFAQAKKLGYKSK